MESRLLWNRAKIGGSPCAVTLSNIGMAVAKDCVVKAPAVEKGDNKPAVWLHFRMREAPQGTVQRVRLVVPSLVLAAAEIALVRAFGGAPIHDRFHRRITPFVPSPS